MKKYFAISVIGCHAIIFFSCKQKAEELTEPERPKTTVSFIQPVTQGFTDYIQLNGNTQFQKQSVVRANITGYITDMRWKQGDHVVAGTLFCHIKTKEQDALKNIDAREPSLKQFQTPISVSTNSSGIITAVNYNKGNYVSEGDILATITDPASLVLQVNVPYEYHSQVYKGKECTVQFPDGKTISAIISEEVPYLDSSSQTQTYLIRFPGNSSLPDNMNLIVHIPVKQSKQSVALPLAAIQADETQEEFWVMKLVNDSMAIRVPVVVGSQHDSLREIISGVNFNDRIIVKGAYGLSDSSLVIIDGEPLKTRE